MIANPSVKREESDKATVAGYVKRLALLLLVVVPIAAWIFVKPVRVIAPTFVGISCHQLPVCIDDPTQLPAANKLYSEAYRFVSGSIAPLAGSPKVIFCSSQKCADSFGLGKRSAVTLGTWGTVVAPRAWKPYYVRHELIHHLQAQRLGVIRLLLTPSWFVEGMAYSLSEDPRSTLAEPWQSDRLRFNAWYGAIAKTRLWEVAGKL